MIQSYLVEKKKKEAILIPNNEAQQFEPFKYIRSSYTCILSHE